MRSLFLAMIPSIAMGAEVGGGNSSMTDAANVSNNIGDTIAELVRIILEAPVETAWGLSLGGALAVAICLPVRFVNKRIPTIDSTFAITLFTVTLGFVWWCLENNILLHIDFKDSSKPGAWCVIFALCFALANIAVRILIIEALSILGVINKGKVLHARRRTNMPKSDGFFGTLWHSLKKFVRYRLKKRKIATQTLYYAAKAFNSMLTKLKETDPTNNCPEFQLTISGDTELLRKLPYLPPYDILHFIELQSIWAKEFNAIQRKIQWRQRKRQEEHKKIVEDRSGGAHCTSCNESCANELHQKLSAIFTNKWKTDAKYYAQEDNHASGIMMNEMVKNAIDQWVKRLPNNNKQENYIVNTRAIRVLFSSEEDLLRSAIKVAQDSTINLPLSKDEIRNVWIPNDDMPVFDYLEDWAKNKNDRDWENKFLRPRLVRSECLNPAQVIETYVEYLKSRYHKESIDDPLKLILKRLGNAINKKKKKNTFMYLFIGNRMEKKSYFKESPQLHKNSSMRIEASGNHLAHLFLVLMALHHKKALPLMISLEKVYKEANRPNNQEKFETNAMKFTRECIKEIRDSMQEKLREVSQ